MRMSESELQVAVANYLAACYPTVLFHSDFGSGVRLTAGQARVNKAQNAGRRGWPDLFVAGPFLFEIDYGRVDSIFCGLFIELKAEGTRLKKKNGDWATSHIAEQAEVLKTLAYFDYAATFAVGFEQAKAVIDAYLSNDDSYEGVRNLKRVLSNPEWYKNEKWFKVTQVYKSD